MLRPLFFIAAMALLPLGGVAAHTVPSMVAEAEFSQNREVALLVNLDPRLILTDQPTSLPPVPATWWFDQNEEARADTLARAAAYVSAQLEFRVGEEVLAGDWKVQAVDSATVAPVSPGSVEVHLLAEHRGPLPGADGAFKMTVGRTCAVATLLMNTMEGTEERQPQLVFPGESSRGFALPPPSAPMTVAAAAKPEAEASHEIRGRQSWIQGRSLLPPLMFVVILALMMRGRFGMGLCALAVFHVGSLLSSWLTWKSWLPVGPGEAPYRYWVLFGGMSLALLLVRRSPALLMGLAAMAGFVHGWGPWSSAHFQKGGLPFETIVWREAALFGAELAAFVIAAMALTWALRKTMKQTAGRGVPSGRPGSKE